MNRKALTLIELLVTISIIAILIGLQLRINFWASSTGGCQGMFN